MSFQNVATYLVEFGVPGTVVTAVGTMGRAYVKRRALAKQAPEIKTDTSMARMQQAAIITDQLNQNLQDENARLQAENARLSGRITTVEETAAKQVRASESAAAALTQQLIERTGELKAVRLERDRCAQQLANATRGATPPKSL